MRQLKFCLGFFVVILFANCKKGSQTEDVTATKRPTTLVMASCDPATWRDAENSSNPADSAGLIHNLAICELDELDIPDLAGAYEENTDFYISRWGPHLMF